MSTWYFCEDRQHLECVHQLVLVQKEPLEVTLYEDLGVMGSKWIAERDDVSEHLTNLSLEDCATIIRGALRDDMQWEILEEDCVPYRWDLSIPQRVFRATGTLHLHPNQIRAVDRVCIDGTSSLWWDGTRVHIQPGIDLLSVITIAIQHPTWRLLDHDGHQWILHNDLIHDRAPSYVPSLDMQEQLRTAVGDTLIRHCFHTT